MPKLLKIGIVGCGTIGSRIAKAIEKNFKKNARLVAICDIDSNKAANLHKKLNKNVKVATLDKLISKSDLIIESASSDASAKIADKAVACGRNILIMSVGGLLGRTDIFRKARQRKVSIYLPSGAICGLDGIKALALTRINKITLTTRKPVKSLPERFRGINKETMIFEGSVKEAVKKFPQNINVAGTLSLAGLEVKNIRVRIITSPRYMRNMHRIEVVSRAGRIITETENVPSPDNPKTSYLAVLSALVTLKQIFDSVRIGT